MYEKNRVLIAGVSSEAEHDTYTANPYDTGKELFGFGINWGTRLHLGYEYHTGVAVWDVAESYEEIDKVYEDEPLE